jgi:hypothetical protein
MTTVAVPHNGPQQCVPGAWSLAMQLESLLDISDSLVGLSLKAIHEERVYRARILV